MFCNNLSPPLPNIIFFGLILPLMFWNVFAKERFLYLYKECFVLTSIGERNECQRGRWPQKGVNYEILPRLKRKTKSYLGWRGKRSIFFVRVWKLLSSLGEAQKKKSKEENSAKSPKKRISSKVDLKCYSNSFFLGDFMTTLIMMHYNNKLPTSMIANIHTNINDQTHQPQVCVSLRI